MEKRKVLTLIVHKSHALQTESTDDEVDGRAGGESLSGDHLASSDAPAPRTLQGLTIG